MRKDLKPEDLGDFLEQPKLALLATTFKDGRVLLSPVCHEWRDGGFTVLIYEGDVKARHIERDARVSIIVAEDVLPHRGIEVRGVAKRVTGDLRAVLDRIALRYFGPEQGPAYAEQVSKEALVYLRIEPGELRVWDFTDGQDITGVAMPKEL